MGGIASPRSFPDPRSRARCEFQRLPLVVCRLIWYDRPGYRRPRCVLSEDGKIEYVPIVTAAVFTAGAFGISQVSTSDEIQPSQFMSNSAVVAVLSL
jgi:hypothetical protein